MGKLKKLAYITLVVMLAITTIQQGIDVYAKKQTFNYDPQVMSSKLLEELSANPDSKLNVMIKLSDQARVEDAKEDARLNKSGESKETKLRKAYIGQLQEIANRTQKPIIELLESRKKTGDVDSYKSFFIVNGLNVVANSKVINAISLMDNVDSIVLNSELTNTKPIIERQRVRRQALDNQLEWNLSMINADKVWNDFHITGRGVTVGIMDSAVSYNHPALKNNFRGYNLANGTVDFNGNFYDALEHKKQPDYSDYMDHGSHCTGIICGNEGDMNKIGVAPDAKWISARVFNELGGATVDQFLDAAQWFLAPGGNAENAPDVINNSWGGTNDTDPWFHGSLEAWRNAGILPVFSSGNQVAGESIPSHGSITNPANFAEAFAVGAVDKKGKLGSFSKKGPSRVPNVKEIKPEISAPGVTVRSAVKSGYMYMSGTSMAAPHVTGVAALLKQANPSLTIEQIENILTSTATAATDESEHNSPNYSYGYGIVNAYAAVKKALNQGDMGTIYGAIKDSQERPINGEVYIKETNQKVNLENNSYELRHISGDYTLVVHAYGYKTFEKAISIEANKRIRVDATLEKDDVKTVTGRVANTSGEKLGGVSVRVVDDSNMPMVETNENGEFTIENLSYGKHTLRFIRSGYQVCDEEINIDSNTGELVITLDDITEFKSIPIGDDTQVAGTTYKDNVSIGVGNYNGMAVQFFPSKKGGFLENVSIYFAEGMYYTNGNKVNISIKGKDKQGRTVNLSPVKKYTIDHKGWNDIDVSEFNLKLDEPFFVVVQVPEHEAGLVLGYDDSFGNENSYIFDDNNFISIDDKFKQGALMIKCNMLFPKTAADNIVNIEPPIIHPINPTDRFVRGSSKPEQKIRIILPTGKRVSAETDSNGDFKIAIPMLAPGSRVEAMAQNKSGYVSKKVETVVRVNVKFLKDSLERIKELVKSDKVKNKDEINSKIRQGEELYQKGLDNQLKEQSTVSEVEALQNSIIALKEELILLINSTSENKAELKKLIDESQALIDNTERSQRGNNIPDIKYWAKNADWQKFNTALLKAKVAYDRLDSSEEELTLQIKKLKDAIFEFKQVRSRGKVKAIVIDEKYKDGTYEGEGRGSAFEASHVYITIKNGRLTSVIITEWAENEKALKLIEEDFFTNRIIENNSIYIKYTKNAEAECETIISAIKQALGKALKDRSIVDKSRLKDAIDVAKSQLNAIKISADGRDVPQNQYWITQENWDEYKRAIDSAEAQYNLELTDDLVNREITKLVAATKNFENRRNIGVIENTAIYQDGSYEVTTVGYSGENTYVVKIVNGRIAEITIKYWNDTPNRKPMMKKLIENIIEKNSEGVDSISGATISSDSLKEAVKIAKLKAAGKNLSTDDSEEIMNVKAEIYKLIEKSKEELYNTRSYRGTFADIGDYNIRQTFIKYIKDAQRGISRAHELEEILLIKSNLEDSYNRFKGLGR